MSPFTPIDQYSDAALRRISRDPRDMGSAAARRELERRELAGGGRTIGPLEIVPPSNVTQIDVVREMRAAYPTPLLAEAIKALDQACVEHGLEGYEGEAVSYLTALLRMAEDPTLSAEDAVKRAYGLGTQRQTINNNEEEI